MTSSETCGPDSASILAPCRRAVKNLAVPVCQGRARAVYARVEAAEALGEIGPEAKEALRALDKLLRDSDPNGRNVAAALGKIRGEARPGARPSAPEDSPQRRAGAEQE